MYRPLHLLPCLIVAATFQPQGLCLSSSARPGPVVPGATLLSDDAAGRVLLGELGCTACHRAAQSAADRVLRKEAPVLGEVGSRVTPQYLRAFLSGPHDAKPGTTMPDLLHGMEGDRKDEVVESLVHFLVSLGGPIDQTEAGASEYQIQQGKLLYHSVGCVACHAPAEPPAIIKADAGRTDDREAADETIPELSRPSVPLGDLAMKTTVGALAAFLLDPLHTRPSGRMPSMKLNGGEANMIAAWLLRDQLSEEDEGWGVGLDVAYYEGGFGKVPDFDKLEPKAEATAKGFDLDIVESESRFAVRWRGLIDIPEAGKYTFTTKSDDGSVLFIDGKRVVDNDGIHAPRERSGSVELSKGRHSIEVGFIQGGGPYELAVRWEGPGIEGRRPIPPGLLLHKAFAMRPKGVVDFRVDSIKAERGRDLFASLGCASCHALGEPAPDVASLLEAPAFSELEPGAAKGCLGDAVGTGRPDYSLSDEQRVSLRGAVAVLQRPRKRGPSRQPIARTLAAMNCYACHERDGTGGPGAGRRRYFVTTTPVDLGEEGRLPPALDRIGAKLNEKGFDLFLFEGLRARPYMATRMPQFGRENIGHLPALSASVDEGLFPPKPVEFNGRAVDDGHRLVGTKGMSCVTCHGWAGRPSAGVAGVDLAHVARRLRPEWFHAWLERPLELRPGTRMPEFWPDGRSPFPHIQGGDMERQINAIWAYLSVGERAPMPVGLSPDDRYLIVPRERPIVFRTFVDRLGTHAIAVGYPERTHVVFDGLHCRMSAAWTGDFLSGKETWSGRAGQYTPITSAGRIDFPPPPTVARLASETSPWPEHQGRDTGGWQFEGYCPDASGVPTFIYRHESGVRVEETATTRYEKEGSWLRRTITVTAAKDLSDLYARVASGGDIEPEGDAYVVDERARYTFAPASEPWVRDGPGGEELIVPVELHRGAGGKREFELGVEVRW